MATRRVKEYTAPDIVVGYDISRCMHAANCVRELPEVFDVNRKPWAQPENADADRVAAQVARCPSGALTARRPDGAPIELTDAEVEIREVKNGPLYISGDIAVTDADGGEFPVGRRVALCRCGDSANKPFCDGTHAKVGFTTD